MSKYPLPEEVTAPRLRWKLIKVLYKGDPSDPEKHDPEGYSIALGMWDDVPCLAVRWNACEERPAGNPQSRGLPTWFVIPKELAEPILSTLTDEARTFAKTLLG